MKKRIISLIVCLSIAIGFLPITELTASAAPASIVRYCEHCDLTETWQPLTNDNKTNAMTTGHYYLSSNIVFPEKIIKGDTQVCLELNNYTYTGNRHMVLESGVILNIQGNGKFCGRGKEVGADGTYSPGGAIWIKSGATLNLYGGDLYFASNQLGRKASRGGVLGVYGTLNMYGGTIHDGEATDVGGNIFVDSAAEFNMFSGTITGGTASTYGNCVYTRGKTTVANDASIEDLVIKPKAPTTKEDLLTIQGAFNGTLCIDFAQIKTPDSVMGISSNADISNANIYFRNNDLKVRIDGDKLISYLPDVAAVMNPAGEKISYETLEQALKNISDGQTLILQRTVDEPVTIDKNITLDLNGRKVNNTLTVSSGITVFAKDSFTDGYSVADGVYGLIKSTSGDIRGAEATEYHDVYMKIEDTKGVSFHAVGLNINSMALRPEDGGLYYLNNFAGDEMVSSRINSFGIALSLSGAPDVSTLSMDGHYSRYEKEHFASGAEKTGTILKGILKDANDDKANLRNCDLTVYGRAYAEIGNGEYLFGVTRMRSMKEQLQLANEQLSLLSYSQKNGIKSLYEQFPSILSKFNLTKLENYINNHEENTLKIMILGSSRSVDAFWLLHEALTDLYPDKDFVLGIMYYSGCSISMHVNFIKQDKPVYVYYRNADGTWETFSETTMQEGLQDQAWDIIVLQGGSGDTANNMNLSGRTFLVDYVNKNVSNPHTFWWHSTWANPNDEVFFSAGWDPQPPAGYKDKLIANYGFDPVNQLTITNHAAKQYVLDDPMFQGHISSGTPVMYANNILRTPQTDLYRDYTHLTDFGRLLVSYAWCVQLFSEPIAEINLDTVPRSLRHRRAQAYGDMKVTQEMKNIIIASANFVLNKDNRWSVPINNAAE